MSMTKEEKKSQAKRLFSNVYFGKPSDFKDNFNKIIGARIYDRIRKMKKNIINRVNVSQEK